MYGKLNKILRSKVALWGITACAIVLFCMTAVIAFGMNARKQATIEPPAEKIPSIQPAVSGLQVQNSSSAGGASTQLQGQSGNGDVSQPAAPAASSNIPELSGGVAATRVQAGTESARVDGSVGNTSVSASLQPVAGGTSSNGGVQAQLNAAGINLGVQAKLP